MIKKERNILVFKLQKDEFAFDISCVREVLSIQEIHMLSRAPEFVKGMMYFKKHMITVVDLRDKLNIRNVNNLSGMNIIICKIRDFIIGLIVDKVSEVLSLTDENFEPAPVEDDAVSAIARVDKRIITILNLENVLTKEEIRQLSKINK
ncbi:purine-binding chemotaxis protein CheW [Candidatus Poribacteria bacterium]|nr:purine-binding chemotaxis protein CheW [Candidatus Poribacteria bacterium]